MQVTPSPGQIHVGPGTGPGGESGEPTRAVISILIPANDEAAVIESCLRSLLSEACAGEFEVLVVCNGCTDDTASIVRRFANESRQAIDLTVVEIDEASKIEALNTGLASMSGDAVIVLDADVLLPTANARSVAALLAAPKIRASSTAIKLDVDGASLLSRSYHRFWVQLPSIAGGLAGRGVYALDAEGLSRLGRFPSITADDQYVNLLFKPSERRIAEGESTVTVAQTARDIIRRKTRVFAGNAELRKLTEQQPDAGSGSWRDVVRAKPAAAIDLPAYLLLNVVAKFLARRQVSSEQIGWNRDTSSR